MGEGLLLWLVLTFLIFMLCYLDYRLTITKGLLVYLVSHANAADRLLDRAVDQLDRGEEWGRKNLKRDIQMFLDETVKEFGNEMDNQILEERETL